uniref:NADH:ubiquinone reductase (H(+)-translocating) n=1 Tax=Divaricobothrium sp. LRP 10377 TaxID=2899474 RepID=A0A8K1W6A2_9CEST|nr:NADH dehydrogenase subunit 5 [Divaricobothrium sp. LRP 10377]
MIFFVFLLMSSLCVAYLLHSNAIIGCLQVLTLNGTYWQSLFMGDVVSISILLMLSICFGYALYYTTHYFGGSSSGNQLNKIICLFVAVMGSLVLTGDLLTTLILWEYLGVVSFFLILFYANYLSLRSSVVTLVSSRFGDVCLFLLIAVSLCTGYPVILMAGIYFFVVFTKSASFPFISWLLEAMRAPTPVSSLVHSSTLVAAGVWFAMRYDMFSLMSDTSIFLMILLLTVFITGVCCFFFLDLKKIVALSTCNNISWCLIYLIFGDVCLSLFQLLSHGVSKCLLFMLVGDVMSGSGGSQASNCVFSPRLYGSWGIFGLFCVTLGLSGAPYIGVFFTKHILVSNFSSMLSITMYFLLLICVFLSYFYSFRLCRILYSNFSSLSFGVLYAFSSGLMVYFWLMLNYFIASSLDETSGVSSVSSSVLLCFQGVSCITAYYFYSSTVLRAWASSLFGCDNVVEYFYNLFNDMEQSVSLFFYRWDNNTLSLFNNLGGSLVTVLNNGLLNIIMISSLLIFVSCFIIVY